MKGKKNQNQMMIFFNSPIGYGILGFIGLIIIVLSIAGLIQCRKEIIAARRKSTAKMMSSHVKVHSSDALMEMTTNQHTTTKNEPGTATDETAMPEQKSTIDGTKKRQNEDERNTKR